AVATRTTTQVVTRDSSTSVVVPGCNPGDFSGTPSTSASDPGSPKADTFHVGATIVIWETLTNTSGRSCVFPARCQMSWMAKDSQGVQRATSDGGPCSPPNAGLIQPAVAMTFGGASPPFEWPTTGAPLGSYVVVPV